MDKYQKRAKKRRREVRELIMSRKHPYVTRLLLASEQAIDRYDERMRIRYP